MLTIKDLDSLFLSNVVKTDNTIRDSLRLNYSNPTDFSCVVAMGSATSLSINTFNIDYTKRVTWNYTSLIEMETEFLFSLSLIHEILVDCVAIIDNSVGLIFNGSFLLLCNTLIMSNIKMGTFNCFFGTILPNMRSKYLSA